MRINIDNSEWNPISDPNPEHFERVRTLRVRPGYMGIFVFSWLACIITFFLGICKYTVDYYNARFVNIDSTAEANAFSGMLICFVWAIVTGVVATAMSVPLGMHNFSFSIEKL